MASRRLPRAWLNNAVRITLQATEPAKNGRNPQGAIREGLEWVKKRITEDDLLIFYFSGNAVPTTPKDDPEAAKAVLMTYDFTPKGSETLSGEQLVVELARMPSRHSLVFIDSCHAALGLDVLGPRERREVIPDDKSVQLLAACRTAEVSYEEPDGGVFSKAVISFLEGPPPADGIAPSDLAQHIQRSVEARKFSQTTTLVQLGQSQVPIAFTVHRE